MPEIVGDGFAGTDTLSREELTTLLVDRPEQTAPKLTPIWRDKARAAVSVFLHNDNQTIILLHHYEKIHFTICWAFDNK